MTTRTFQLPTVFVLSTILMGCGFAPANPPIPAKQAPSTKAYSTNEADYDAVFTILGTKDFDYFRDFVKEKNLDPSGHSPYGYSILSLCAQDPQYLQHMRLLLELGAIPNVEDEGGGTPLEATCGSIGNIEGARLLIAKGADINGGPRSRHTPLGMAIHWEHDALARYLIEKGATVVRTFGEVSSLNDMGYRGESP